MGKMLAFAIVLLLSALAFSASPGYSLLPPRSGVDATGMPADSAGVVISPTADSQNRVNVLSLALEGGCAGNNINVKADTDSGAAAGAKVRLFTMSAPRTELAEISANQYGRGAFGPRPSGKYEVVASLSGYRDARAAVEVAACNYAFQAQSPAAGRDKPVVISKFSQVYANGFSRTFTAYGATVGTQVKKYTDITLRYNPSSPQQSANLMETIPQAVWLNPKTIGYSTSYPIMVSNGTPIMVVWRIGQQADGAQTAITYRIEREITGPMAEAFGQPQVFFEGENISVNYTAPKAAASAPAPPKTGSEAALSAPEIPSWAVTAAIGIILVGITAFAILRALTKPSS